MTEKLSHSVSHGMTQTELDDLQVWLRHGRIGTGRGYQEEVARARRIDAEQLSTSHPLLSTERQNLTSAERGLLEWLQKGDGQYGECQGKTLDGLIERKLVIVHGAESGLSNGFIAKGTDIMYRAVSITDAGRSALSSNTRTTGED